MNSIIKNKKGGATILITVLVLFTILTVGLSLANVIINGLRSSVVQANATQAYFAAEAAAEKYLYEVRKNRVDVESFCFDGEYVFSDFSNCNPVLTASSRTTQANGTEYYSMYELSGTLTRITNFGEFRGTRRAVRLTY